MECLDDDTIANYVGGALEPAAAQSVDAHARDCERCRRLLGVLLASPARNDAATAAAPTQPQPQPHESDVQRLMRALGHGHEANRVGQVLAEKYRLERQLGSGGMGVVYEAENTWTRRRVALKLLRGHFSKDAEMVRRFLREARAASRITHPNVVDILDLGQDKDGALFMVQEFLVGRTLRQRLESERALDEAEARAILLPIMDALAAAHALGIVHRDVKPENIFLAQPNPTAPVVPTLIDFGVSKRAAPDSLDPTETGHPIGTPLYMSPEQLRAHDDLDGRADVWAIGVVLFEALAGRRPFDAAHPSDVIARVLTQRAPQLATVAPRVSPAVAALVDRALEPDRDKRFASMQAMADAWRAAPIVSPSPSSSKLRAPLLIAVALILVATLGLALAFLR